MSYEDLTYEVKDRVAVLTLNRPDRLNAWTGAMEASVKRAMAAANSDDNVRVIVMTGAGRGFCAGADMGLLQKIEAAKGDGSGKQAEEEVFDFSGGPGPEVGSHYGGRFGYFMQVKKPIIAAINGPAAGLGLVVSLYADMRFAASDAKFTTAFANRGLIAEHGCAWLLPNLIGTANALDILMSGRKFMADEAERMGLVNKVFPQAGFMDEVMAYARGMVETVSPRSMAVMKAQIWKMPFQDFSASLDRANHEMQESFGSEDFKEGVAHFVEKRAPSFTGR